MIDAIEIQKKLDRQKVRLEKIDASRQKVLQKINDYEAALRVIEEISKTNDKKKSPQNKTTAEIIEEVLKSAHGRMTRSDIIAAAKINHGYDLKETTVTGTLQRLKGDNVVDNDHDQWFLTDPTYIFPMSPPPIPTPVPPPPAAAMATSSVPMYAEKFDKTDEEDPW